MAEDPASGADHGFGFLLDATGGLRPADLYDPATGKALLIAMAPLDPAPPRPDAIRIGIVDSGILADHPQLRGLVLAARDFTGNDPVDRIGHGTLVALRMVESQARTLHELRTGHADLAERLAGSPALVVAKVTDAQGRIEVRHVIEAIHWLVAEGCRSVNLSLGFTGTAGRWRDLCQAIAQYASEPDGGVFFAAAAGNFGPDVPVYPAACGVPNLISVGAVIDGALWPRSGRADILAEGQAIVMPPAAYHHALAQLAARAGDLDRARQSYRASLAAEENAPALFGLALVDAAGGDLDAAATGLERAAALAPDTPMIEAQLGAVQLLRDRPLEARRHLDRALALDPGNPDTLVDRAIALVRLGERRAALSDLIQARARAEDHTRIDAMILELVGMRAVPPPGATGGP